jgi:hypothetical protein
VVVALGFERVADLLAHTLEIGQVEAAVAPARRAHADERQISGGHGFGGVGRGTERATRRAVPDQFVEAAFHDRAAPFVQARDFVGIDVHTDDRVAISGEGGRRHAADVTQPEYRNIH